MRDSTRGYSKSQEIGTRALVYVQAQNSIEARGRSQRLNPVVIPKAVSVPPAPLPPAKLPVAALPPQPPLVIPAVPAQPRDTHATRSESAQARVALAIPAASTAQSPGLIRPIFDKAQEDDRWDAIRAKKKKHGRQQQANLPRGPESPSSSKFAGPGPYANISVVRCQTTVGDLTIEVRHDWAPRGSRRFLEMVEKDFFKTKVAFYKGKRGGAILTGVHGVPGTNSWWESKKGRIPDDRQWIDMRDTRRMKRGYVMFTASEANSRITEFTIIFRDLPLGWGPGDVPFGALIGDPSYEVLDHLFVGYGDGPSSSPQVATLRSRGNDYLQEQFPELDYINVCYVLKRGAR